jgi:hypothetical protein
VSTVNKFDPVGLLPLSTGGSLVVMVSVPDLWIVTPSFPSWKIIVYPFSAILSTLRSDFLSPGSMWASLASFDSCSNGNKVLSEVWSVELSGRYTLIFNAPV